MNRLERISEHEMSVLDSMQGFLEKHVGPIAHKVSSFKVVKGLMSGMMATMPVTLGVALLSIINGLPIPPLQAFLTGTGCRRRLPMCWSSP